MKLLRVTILAVLILALGVVVSGCIKKPFTNVIPVNTEIQDGQNGNTATSTAEIDTSDWKTYRNEEYGFEILYLPDYTLVVNSGEEIIFEKVLGPEVPNSQIYLRIYRDKTLNDIIQNREKEINDGIFQNRFKEKRGSDGSAVYILDKYTDALGAISYSERIFKKNSIYVAIQVSTTSKLEFKRLNDYLSQIASF